MRLFDDIGELLGRGEGLIVPTRSRAAAIRLAYARAQLQTVEVWRTPVVTAANGWLSQLTRELFLEGGGRIPRPLGTHEEWCLWHDAARALLADRDDARPFIWSAESLADALQRSARLCAEWGIDDGALARHPSAESEWLLRARREVSRAARDLGAIASFESLRMLSSVELQRRDHHAFLGELVPPLLADLFERTGVRRLQPQTSARAQVTHHVLPTPTDEIAAAAHWARLQLEVNPQARLYVVVPELEARRAEIERHFISELTPSRWQNPDVETQFDVEGGQPLSEYDEPRQILQLMRWLTSFDEAESLARLIEGDVFADLAMAPRARLAARLRRHPFERAEARGWLARLERISTAVASDLSVLRDVRERLDLACRELESSSELWASRFTAISQQCVFAHRPARDSTIRQIREQWRDLLKAFANIESSRRESAGKRAVGLLAAMAQREYVAPSRGELPVTITRSLDHPGVHYDGIYVCGLQSDTWPSPQRAEPFVPYLLQRALGIPEVSAHGQAARARIAMRQWAQSTEALYYSSALRDGETELQPSPLLREYGTASADRPDSLALRLRAAQPTVLLVTITDDRGTPWDAERRIPGGAETLATEALCDFRAYAERRLLGREDEELEPGVSALARGSLLHKALQALWRDIGNSQRLQSLTSDQLTSLIEASLAEALTDEAALILGTEAVGSSAWLQLLERERRRSDKAIRKLLACERERSEFTVLHREYPVALTLGNARLALRIDRVDQVLSDDGAAGLMILDYKSGRYRSLKFSIAQMDAVQLWLYALSIESAGSANVVGMANVHLTSAECRYAASTENSGLLPGVKASRAWAEQREQLRRELEALAGRFLAGVATVRPSTRACRYCDLQGLCRRAELADEASSSVGIEETLE